MSATCPACGAAGVTAQLFNKPEPVLVEPSVGGDHLVTTVASGAVYAKKVMPGQGDHVDHAAACPKKRSKGRKGARRG